MIQRLWRQAKAYWSQRRIDQLIADLQVITEEQRPLLQAGIWPYTEEVIIGFTAQEDSQELSASTPAPAESTTQNTDALDEVTDQSERHDTYSLLTHRLEAYAEVIRCLHGTTAENSNLAATTSVIAILNHSDEISDAITDIYQAVAHDIHRISRQTLVLHPEHQEA